MMPSGLQRRVDQAGVAQQEDPGVGADQEAGPERQHDELQVEVLVASAAREMNSAAGKAMTRQSAVATAAMAKERSRMVR